MYYASIKLYAISIIWSSDKQVWLVFINDKTPIQSIKLIFSNVIFIESSLESINGVGIYYKIIIIR